MIAERFLEDGHPVTWMIRPCHLGHLMFGRRTGPPAMRTDDGALVIAPLTLLPRLPWPGIGPTAWEWFAKRAYSSIVPRLDRTFAKHAQPHPDVIWTTGGDGGALRKYFPKAKRVVQCVDLYEAFDGPDQNRLEEKDYADADAVISIGHALGKFLHLHRRVPVEKICVIGQGVDLDLYQKDVVQPTELIVAQRPRLVWVGVTAKADAELMEAALGALPAGRGSLVIIGPPAPWAERLAAQDHRVIILGSRPPDVVPSYLKHCDVGLMLYDQKVSRLKYIGQHPLKLYEFAGARLAIVSTPHDEYQYLCPPLIVASGVQDTIVAVRKALEMRGSLGDQAFEFARQHTWKMNTTLAQELVAAVLNNGPLPKCPEKSY